MGTIEDGNVNLVETSPMSLWQHPPSFYCPISQQCMHDPVVLSDGHTYERRHIERWLQHHGTSPVTGAHLAQKDVFPNHALRNAIEEYFQQVFSVHRRAIRERITGEGVNSSAGFLRTINSLMQCSLLVSADLSAECVLRQIMQEAKALLGAETASVFLVDADAQELYSTVNSTGGELRIPINAGIAGHVATSGELVVIKDAYSDERFNKAIDSKTGFRTRNMMCAPLKTKKGKVIGVVQLINKIRAGCGATDKLESDAHVGTLTSDQGKMEASILAFTGDDVSFLMVFASQAATAIATSEGLERTPLAQARVTGDKQGPSPRLHALPSSSSKTDDGEAVLGKRAPQQRDADLEKRSTNHCPDDACFDCSSTCERVHVMIGSPSDTSHPPTSMDSPTCESCSARAQQLLCNGFSSWKMDTLALADATDNRPLSSLGMFLFDRLELQDHFGYDRMKLSCFLQHIEKGYDEGCDNGVSYHNRAHAASVLHAMHALLLRTGFAKLAALAFKAEDCRLPGDEGHLELMACLLAAIVHDYEHKGLSNDFLVKTNDERASRFNDQHVNEHHHVAAAFAVLLLPEHNFLECLSTTEFRHVRGLVIDLVLGTDMANSGQIMSSFGQALDKAGVGHRDTEQADVRSDVHGVEAAFVPSNSKEAVLLLQIALKCSDLGHLALPWNLHVQWVRRLEAEFFAQGDRERELGLPVSFLMDRNKPGASETQLGFFEFVVFPLFRAIHRAAPSAEPLLLAVMANCERWRALAAPADEASQSGLVGPRQEDEPANGRKKRSGRSRQRLAKWKRSVRCRTPSPLSP